ncbi:MAG: T9SS type A sorting domain-containing protein [Flavobacteriales bacterium]
MKKIYALSSCAMLFLASTGKAQTATSVLDINNVHALFYANGRISQTAFGSPYFFVPATLGDNGPSPLFTGSIWIGGLDPDSILRFAGERFEQNGLDFFPGPLGTDAGITQATSTAFNRVYKVQRIDLERQAAYFNCLSDPNCDAAAEFPGYTVPDYFFDWPANGDVALGQALNLADYYDYDQNGEYDPEAGDMPCVPGDQALFSIYNDKLAAHTESGGAPIGVEVHMTPFAYSSNQPAINQTVFVRYRIFNRSAVTLYKTYIGLFDDFDLGCPNDDYVQCDVGRNLFFALNGDDNDEDCNGVPGYGSPGPAFGLVVLKGPKMDADGIDNTDTSVLPGFNGRGFNDGIADNERLGLGRFNYFLNSSGPTGDPYMAAEYYGYLAGNWADGTPQSYGGSGYDTAPDAIHARYAFPGTSDPLGVGTDGVPQPAWTQASAGFPPADQRGFGALGPFTFQPGDEQEIVIAYIYARPATIGENARVETLNERTDTLRAFAETIPGLLDGGFDCSLLPTAIGNHAVADRGIRLFPNPASGLLRVRLSEPSKAAQLSVFDAQGTLVLQQAVQQVDHTLDVSDLNPGLYLVRVQADGRTYSRSFVKE